ncbi:hypothetical protein K474DRAFT_1667146 [Panus rudis PR-1116 ss-1]|nr:hypothetical protein K474DRAFT_1667146 [Panus rudis PR-1116 ss-1]
MSADDQIPGPAPAIGRDGKPLPPGELPWLRFPPFPQPPPGVTIIPFKDFKPSGLYVREEDSEEDLSQPMPQEIDPLGIPTVTLRAKHGLTEGEQARKKKKRKTPAQRAAAAGGSQPRRLLWFEEWEAGEAFRKTSSPVNPMSSRVDRLHQACQDFKSSRQQVWPSTATGASVPQLWENLRLYIGIISSIQPPMSRKRMQEQAEEADEDSDEDDDGPSSKPKVEMVDSTEARERRMHKEREEADERRANLDDAAVERIQKRMNRKDSRMEFFLNDPELAMKIFFSAHYRDKGLIWDRVRCRDGPILVEFFLNFILRNRILPEPEYEKGFRRALEVVKLAKKELPLTFTLGEALPDATNQALESLMGDMTRGMYWTTFEDDEEEDGMQVDDDAAATAAKQTEELKQLGEFVSRNASISGPTVQVIDPNDPSFGLSEQPMKDAVADNVDINGVPADPTSGGWGTLPASTADDTPGWSTWGDAAPAGGDWPGGWGDSNDNPTVIDDWLTAKPPFLMESMGPTALPLTHTTGIVERSTRRILKVVPPPSSTSTGPSAGGKKTGKGKFKDDAEAVEEELEKRFGYIVLGPWKKVGNHVSSDIQEPMILPNSRGPIHISDSDDTATSSTITTSGTPDHAYDPKKDTINVLIHPDTVSKISAGSYMGLNATFVQIARIDPSGDPDAPDQYLSSKTPKSGGKGKGKGKKGQKRGAEGVNGVPTKFWYMEQLAATIPSFHTDRLYEQQKTEFGVVVKE